VTIKENLFLVAGDGNKHVSASPAGDMYRSTLFRLASDYVEKRGDTWFILSAHHWLLDPSFTIWPYDLSLESDYSVADRVEWAEEIVRQIVRFYDAKDFKIVILAGRLYREHLVGILQKIGFLVETPLAGLEVGQQKTWFKTEMAKIAGYPLQCDQCGAMVRSYTKTDILGLVFHYSCFGNRTNESNRKIGLALNEAIQEGIGYNELNDIKALLDVSDDDADDDVFEVDYDLDENELLTPYLIG